LGKGIALSIFLGLLIGNMIYKYLPEMVLFQERFIGLLVLVLAFASLSLYCFWKVAYPGIVAILDLKGVWLKKQGVVIPWKDIKAYSSKYRYNKYWPVSEVYLLTADRTITLDLSLTDLSTEAVEWFLHRFKSYKHPMITDKEY
jgi:hypothetical protein